MDKFVSDQAAGLRRLLGQAGFQVITVMSGQQGAGKTAATANLAVALARSGRDVLIIDQDQHGRGAAAALGLVPRFDLLDVIEGRCALEALILNGPDNVQVLPIGGSFNRLGRLSERDQEWLARSFNHLQCGVDVVLVDMEEATDPDAGTAGDAVDPASLSAGRGRGICGPHDGRPGGLERRRAGGLGATGGAGTVRLAGPGCGLLPGADG
jgi:flagellar biosynthesis protein FlhG